MIHWHVLINKVRVSQPKEMIVSQAFSLMCNRASGLFTAFTDIPHLYLRFRGVENGADRHRVSWNMKSGWISDFTLFVVDYILAHLYNKQIYFHPVDTVWCRYRFFWVSKSKIRWIYDIFLSFKSICSQSNLYRCLVNANYNHREDSQRGVTTVAVIFLQR